MYISIRFKDQVLALIHTDSLTKRFGSTTVVDDVSITVEQGEIYGFLGLNGAGKTTTIRMLLGMTNPNSGGCRLFGKPVGADLSVWNDVGYLVEAASAYPRLSVFDNLKVAAYYRGINDESLISDIIERLHLGMFRNKKAKELSMGNLQRLALAKALFHRPKLLILDEPINGLDPAGIVEVRNLLIDLAHDGSTIFLSSHILSEISKLATRIGIIHNGRMIREMTTVDLTGELQRKLIVDTTDNLKAIQVLSKLNLSGIINSNNVVEISDAVAVEGSDRISTLLVEAGCAPKQLFRFEEDLEHYFLRLIEHKE